MTKSTSLILEPQRSRASSSRGAPVLPHNPPSLCCSFLPQTILSRHSPPPQAPHEKISYRDSTVTLFQFFLKERSSLCSSKGANFKLCLAVFAFYHYSLLSLLRGESGSTRSRWSHPENVIRLLDSRWWPDKIPIGSVVWGMEHTN